MNLDTTGFPQIILDAVNDDTYELPERTLCGKYFGNSTRVLELGSAVGAVGISTVLAHPKLEWVAYDANPWCVNRAIRNFTRNGVSGTINQGVVVADFDATTIPFYVREEFWNSSLDSVDPVYSKTVEVINVPVVKFNDMAYRFDTLLIDIEGGEVGLLVDSLELASISHMVIEFHPQVYGQDEMERLKRYIVGKGFNEVESIGVVSYYGRR